MIVVLMGVSGAGKTTIGKLLAERMRLTFADADDFHSQANREKMAAAHALSDEDRAPWLDELNRLLRSWATSGTGGVLVCSALKQSYREILENGLTQGTLRFVLLQLSREEIANRLAHRVHSFMNPELLESQIATLEIPSNALTVINSKPPEQVAEEIVRRLHAETL